MVYRLNDVTAWKQLVAGSALFLPGQARKVRFDVNAPGPCRADIVIEGNPIFLGFFEGLETFEFHVPGDVELVFTGPDEVWFQTADGQSIGYEALAASYTKPMQRKARNPDLERMLYKLELSARRREAAMQADMEARLAALAAKQGADPETGEVSDGKVDGDAASATDDDSATSGAPAGKGRKAKADRSEVEIEGTNDGSGA